MTMELENKQKERKALPWYAVLIIALGSIFTIVGFYKGFLEAKLEKEISQLYDEKYSSTSSETYTGVKPVYYKGLSLYIPKGWTYETEENGILHQMTLESADVDMSIIVWAPSVYTLSPREWIQNTYDNDDGDLPILSPSAISSITYCGCDAYTFSFSSKKLGFTYYDKIICFEKDGYTLMILNMSDYRSHLSKMFDFIEKTLTVI